MDQPLPSPEFLRKILRYKSSSGDLFWRKRPMYMFAQFPNPSSAHAIWNRKYTQRPALMTGKYGVYRRGCLFLHPHIDRAYPAHRVIWAMVNDVWPDIDDIVRHKNKYPSDNRITNLTLQKGLKNE